MKATRRLHVEPGACRQCAFSGKVTVTPVSREKGLCLPHLKKHRGYNRKSCARRRAAARATGLCVRCPRDRKFRATHGLLCENHHRSHMAYKKRTRVSDRVDGRIACAVCRRPGHKISTCPNGTGVCFRPRGRLTKKPAVPVLSSWYIWWPPVSGAERADT